MNTIDEQMMTLRWKTVVPVVAGMLFVSNVITAYKYQIDENKQEIIYERERTDRKIKSTMTETKQLIYISELEEMVREKDKEIKKYEKK